MMKCIRVIAMFFVLIFSAGFAKPVIASTDVTFTLSILPNPEAEEILKQRHETSALLRAQSSQTVPAQIIDDYSHHEELSHPISDVKVSEPDRLENHVNVDFPVSVNGVSGKITGCNHGPSP